MNRRGVLKSMGLLSGAAATAALPAGAAGSETPGGKEGEAAMTDSTSGAALRPARYYNHQVAVAGFSPSVEDYSTTTRPHGYGFSDLNISGAVTDSAGVDHIFGFGVSANATSRPPMLISRRKGGSLSLQAPAPERSYTGPLVVTSDAAGTRFEGRAAAKGAPSFEIAAGPDHLRAHQSDVRLDCKHPLALNLMIPELELYHPLICYSPEGEIAGKKIVGGYVTHGAIFLSSGRTLMDVQRAGYTTWKDVWCMGVNVYDTGEREWIHLMRGKENYGFVLAIMQAPGKAPVVTAKSVCPKLEIEGDVNNHAGAYRFVYRTEDGDWEADVGPGDRVADVPMFAWARMRRIGERRKISQSWGQAEMFFSSYGDPMPRMGALMRQR